MNICWLSESPDIPSGYGTQTFKFAQEFIKAGNNVSVIAINNQQPAPYIYKNIKVYPLGSKHNQYMFRQVFNAIPDPVDIFVVFLDIHFVHYLFPDNEKDIKARCPFVLYHLWDNAPMPKYNQPVYESLDKVICGSKFSYNLLKDMIPGRFSYAPLGADPNDFYPLPEEQRTAFRKQLLGKDYDKVNFIIGSTNANILRKRLADLVVAYEHFSEIYDDVALFLHCNIFDRRGVNLEEIRRMFIGNNPKRHLILSPSRNQSFEYLNKVYNACDVTINMAHSEGFGLQTVESMLAGVPPVVGNFGNHGDMTGNAGYLIDPAVTHITGGFGAEYIYEHYIAEKDLIDTLSDIRGKGIDTYKEKQKLCREQGMQFAIQDSAKKLVREFEDIIINTKRSFVDYTTSVL